MNKLLLLTFVLLPIPATFATEPKQVEPQAVLTGKQRQEVAMREAAFRYLVTTQARHWNGVRRILVASGAPPAALRLMRRDGFTVVAKEPRDKTQVCFVTESPIWSDQVHARIGVQVNFYNLAISTPKNLHGAFETFHLRLRRRGDHWQVRGTIEKRWSVMVS